MTAQRLEKLQGHTNALVNAFLGLRLNYGLLKPLLGNPNEPVDQPSPGVLRTGLSALRNTLFLSCVLDVVKLAWDKDDRAPSIARLIAALDDPSLVDLIAKQRMAADALPREPGDEQHESQLRELERTHANRRRQQLDDLVSRLRANWQVLDTMPFKSAFVTMRNKHIAHLEVRLRDGTYEPVDIGDLGATRGDLGLVISAMESVVRDLNTVLRDADFHMKHAATTFDKHGVRFWKRLME